MAGYAQAGRGAGECCAKYYRVSDHKLNPFDKKCTWWFCESPQSKQVEVGAHLRSGSEGIVSAKD